jgi:uncharacterized protein (TIGR02453 family)
MNRAADVARRDDEGDWMARFDAKRALRFLSDLAQNNERAWFEEHRAEYQAVAADFEELVRTIVEGLAREDRAFARVDPRKLIFRLNRDLRFSKDKTPYKTHLAAVLSANGKSAGRPGAFLSVGPGDQSGWGVGLYEPDAQQLASLRKAIDRGGAALEKLLAAPPLKKRFGGLSGELYARVPKPYAPDHPRAELLRRRNFFVWREVADRELAAIDVGKTVLADVLAAEPLRAWLQKAAGPSAER